VEKCASFKLYISKTPQKAATAPLKCQQHHPHQHHLNPQFSQHSSSVPAEIPSSTTWRQQQNQIPRSDAVKVGADFLSPVAFCSIRIPG